MAKAAFHKHQKVWVEAVGAWAVVERIQPIWAKGFDEPVRITYDVGLGREFQAHELAAEAPSNAEDPSQGPSWRILRARNKWQAPEDCPHHPMPGTFPVVVTDAQDWGGWRVPGAEYDRDPLRIEEQARVIAAAPRLLALAREVAASVADMPEDAPPEMQRLASQAEALIRSLADQPPPPKMAAE